MNCPRCQVGVLAPDVNNRNECPTCGYHPDVLRLVDLESIAPPPPETLDELRARHDARVAEASPGVIRRNRDVGPGQRVETVDPKDVEIASLRERLAGLSDAVLAACAGQAVLEDFGAESAVLAAEALHAELAALKGDA